MGLWREDPPGQAAAQWGLRENGSGVSPPHCYLAGEMAVGSLFLQLPLLGDTVVQPGQAGSRERSPGSLPHTADSTGTGLESRGEGKGSGISTPTAVPAGPCHITATADSC